MSNSYYDSLTSPVTNQPIGNLSFEGLVNLPIVPAGDSAIIPLIGSPPQVNGYSGSSAAYLALRALISSTLEDLKNRQGNWEAYAQLTQVTVPGNASGQQQVFQFGPTGSQGGMRLWSMAFSSVGANITITNVEVKRALAPNTDYRSVIPFGTTIGAAGVNFTLGNVFNPSYGFQTLEGNGALAVRFTMNNTSASAETFEWAPVGEQYARDDIRFDIQYQSPTGTIYILAEAVSPDLTVVPIDLMIPVALTDSGASNYGQLVIVADVLQQFYDTFITVEVIVLASLIYLTPGA